MARSHASIGMRYRFQAALARMAALAEDLLGNLSYGIDRHCTRVVPVLCQDQVIDVRQQLSHHAADILPAGSRQDDEPSSIRPIVVHPLDGRRQRGLIVSRIEDRERLVPDDF